MIPSIRDYIVTPLERYFFQPCTFIAAMHYSIGSTYYKQRNFIEALIFLESALGYYESFIYELKCLSLQEEFFSPDDMKIGQTLSNIGLCYKELDEDELALEYLSTI